MAEKLKLIECTHGYAETPVGGHTYVFDRDGYGRFTCDVFNLTHRSLLLSVVHYREVERELPPADLSALDFADESEHAGDGDDDQDEDADNDGADLAQNDVAQEPGPEGEGATPEPEPEPTPEPPAEPAAEPVAAEPAAAPAPKSTRKGK